MSETKPTMAEIERRIGCLEEGHNFPITGEVQPVNLPEERCCPSAKAIYTAYVPGFRVTLRCIRCGHEEAKDFRTGWRCSKQMFNWMKSKIGHVYQMTEKI